MSLNAIFRSSIVALLALAGLAVSQPAARAQQPSDAPQQDIQPDTSLGVALRSLAARAGVVFVGQVTAIERSGDVVLVHFRVDQPILGDWGDASNPYTLREWAGLWPMGESRFYPGLRAMIFLHAPSSSGFSSPVDGMEGLVPVIPQGADQPPVLDIRRLDTRIQRAAGSPLPDASASAITLADAATVVQHWTDPTWTEPTRLALPVEVAPPAAQPEVTAPRRLVPSVPHPSAPQPMSVRRPLPVLDAPR